MLRNVLKAGACALGLVVIVGITGCQPQNGSSSTTSTSMNWSTQNADGGALVNQGRFPAPTYSQEPQPAYALTGQDNDANQEWATLGNYYQVGNDRVSFPAAP